MFAAGLFIAALVVFSHLWNAATIIDRRRTVRKGR